MIPVIDAKHLTQKCRELILEFLSNTEFGKLPAHDVLLVLLCEIVRDAAIVGLDPIVLCLSVLGVPPEVQLRLHPIIRAHGLVPFGDRPRKRGNA